jgi:hypothetical protein
MPLHDKEIEMPQPLRATLAALGFSAACCLTLVAAPMVANASATSMMKVYDTDHDGTLSAKEAMIGARAKFMAADTDHDGTVDAKEMHGLMAKTDFARADTDNDGTLTMAEYTAAAMRDFKAADTDRDATLDAKELASPAGLRLQKLMK